MSSRAHYSAEARRALLAQAHAAIAQWTKPRGRSARVQLSHDRNALVLLVWYDNRPSDVKTVRVACDELTDGGPWQILRIIARELPLRPVPGRR